MASSSRIVFLINEDILQNNKTVLAISNIHISCLRILVHYAYASSVSNVKSSLVWGYKFFSSKKVNRNYKCMHYPLLDFSILSFGQFEQDLYKRADEGEVVLSEKNNHHEGEQIRLALTEILADFQWDRPELFSPVKKSTHRPKYINQIFMFTECPQTLNNFFQSSSTDSFIDSLLPNMLKEKFCYHLNISLVWINTAASINDETKSIIGNGLKEIKGALIDIDTLSMCWLNRSSRKCLDMVISQSSLLDTLLRSGKVESKSKVYETQLKWRNQPAFFTNKTSFKLYHEDHSLFNNEVHQNIDFLEVIPKTNLSIESIQPKARPSFYVWNNIKTGFMNDVFTQKKAFIISVASHETENIECYLIPYTFHLGVVLWKRERSTNHNSLKLQTSTNYKSVKFDEEENETNVSTERERKILQKILKKSKRESLNTSVTNIIDPWFIGNAYLGFPPQMKQTLTYFHKDTIENEQNCEKNSTDIVNFIKSKIKDDSDSFMKRYTHRKSSMKGLTWARWRLLEFQKKQQSMNKLKETDDNMQSMKSDERLNEEITRVEDIKISNVKEFKDENEMGEYCKEIYKNAVQNMGELLHVSSEIVQTIQQFYENNTNGEKYKTECMNFMKSYVIQSVDSLKKSYLGADRDTKLKHEYMCQAVLICSCVRSFVSTDNTETDNLLKQIVSFLRSLSFLNGPSALQDFLRKTILPRYAHNIAGFLRSIYDELMIDPPDILDDSDNVDNNPANPDISPLKSIQRMPSSINSYDGSEMTSSVGSYTCDRPASLRRHSSFIGDSITRKTIAISQPHKKEKRPKDGYKKKESEKSKNVPVTPRRRKSEPHRRYVPDTPEAKQINDMIWKKQDRERRHSFVKKNMKPIEESPLKEISSPIKRKTLVRSNSFQVRSSPRRFYKIKRHHTSKLADSGVEMPKPSIKNELDSEVFIENTQDLSQFAPESLKSNAYDSEFMDMLLTRKSLRRTKSVLLMNFTERNNFAERSNFTERKEIFAQSQESKSNNTLISTESFTDKTSCRKNIFENRSSTLTSGTESSLSSLSSGSVKRRLSSSEFPMKKQRLAEGDENAEPFTFKIFGKDIKPEVNTEKRPLSNFICDSTTDWVSLIAKEQNESPARLNMKEELEKVINTPRHQTIKNSPTIVKAGENSISVSPCLSASSLQLLENAPILSPELGASKRKLRRRKKLDKEF